MKSPVPTELRLRRQSRVLEVRFDDGAHYELPCEFLRVYSPSAEVRGHGGGEPLLIGGKRDVNIRAVEPVGQYAVRLRFDDGHDTGLYTWEILRDLGQQQATYWQIYLERLEKMGMSRDRDVVKLAALPKKYIPTQG